MSSNNIYESLEAKLDNLLQGSIPHPPGNAGMLTRAFCDMAPRPVKEVGIVGGLGLLAGICGKAYSTPGFATGLNLFVILLARSAIGKEAMHTGIRRLMNETDTLLQGNKYDFVTPEECVSAPALIKMLEHKHSTVNVAPEIGHILCGLMDRRADQNKVRLKGTLLNLWAASGPSGGLGGLRYSDSDKNTQSTNVAYSLLGETTPYKFNNDITEEEMANGFLSRFLVFEYQGDRPEPNTDPKKPSEALLKGLSALMAHALFQQVHSPYQQVQYSELSESILNQYQYYCDEKIRAAGADEARRHIWNRAHLNALKIACLLAVVDDHLNPIIQQEHAEWAIQAVTRNVRIFEQKLESGDIGVANDSNRTKKLMELVKRTVKGDFDHLLSPKIIELRKNHHQYFIPRRVLQNKTANMKPFKEHPLGATAALDKTLDALTKSGLIEKHSGSGGEKTPWSNNSLPKGEYYLILEQELERVYYHMQTTS